MTFNITWELEKVDLWNDNGRFSDPALTTIYECTKIGHEKEQELQLTISKTLFIQCIPDCESCNGYVVITGSGRHYRCGCIHHNFVGLKGNRS